ncbi:MAG: hypothetical protein V1800_08720 [Candidatus Latescibacterota bacterium]
MRCAKISVGYAKSNGARPSFGFLSVFRQIPRCPMPPSRSFPPAAPVALALLLLWSGPAMAHKVNLFAYVEGDSVFTESYFGDGRKAVGAQVVVYDRSDAPLLEGRTDRDGLFAFKIPRIADLKIVLQTDMGHRNEYSMPQSELGGAGVTLGTGLTEGGTSATGEDEWVTPGNTDQLAEKIDRVMAQRLAPISAAVRIIRMDRDRTDFRNVIGGIGYIVGIAGVLMMLRSRKKN